MNCKHASSITLTIGNLLGCTSVCGKDIGMPCRVETDSRKIKEGDIFVALKGERLDGHDFILDAVRRGARGVILKQEEMPKYSGLLQGKDVTLFGVQSPERAIVDAAVRYLSSFSSLKDIIAITGSVGKTTTKDAIGRILQGKYKAHVSAGNHNTLLGCSLTVLSAPSDTEYLVLEMGANAKGEIAEIADHFPPSMAVITSVEPVHLEGFGDIRGVLEAKLEIVTPHCEVLFINGDCSLLAEGVAALTDRPSRVITIGRDPSCMFKILDTKLHQDGHQYLREVLIETPLGVAQLESKLWGEQHAMVVAVATAVGYEIGLNFDDIASSLREMSSPKGRGALLKSDEGIMFVDESYNASPVTVKAALKNLLGIPSRGRRIAVLGGMRELGGFERKFHREVFETAISVADVTILYGKEWNNLSANDKEVLHLQDIEEIVNYLKGILRSGDIVLVKGSRVYEMERIYEWWSLNEL